MNNKRRQEIQDTIDSLEIIMCDEQDYLDQMPENLQDSERAATSQESIDNLEYAIGSLQEILNL